MTEPIYHLAGSEDWAAGAVEYRPSSFEEEGFIHCSSGEQVGRVARERFMWDNDLVELKIDPDSLADGVVYEDLTGDGELFPHVYGPIPTSAVMATGPYLAHLEEGMWLPAYRFDPAWMDRMLHPDFAEVGMSGHTHTRTEVVGTTAADITVHLPHQSYRLILVDEDVAMARYISIDTYDGLPRRAHRTSLWLRTEQGWRMRFHQGTPIATPEPRDDHPPRLRSGD